MDGVSGFFFHTKETWDSTANKLRRQNIPIRKSNNDLWNQPIGVYNGIAKRMIDLAPEDTNHVQETVSLF